MANTIKLKRGSGSDPSASDLAVGEVALRTDNAKLFTKNDAGNVAQIGGGLADVVDDSTPQLGGDLDVNTNNIIFGDSSGTSDDRLTFGAGTDLSIYHDGTDTAIVNSTGDFYITNNGDDLLLQALDDVVIKTQGGADVSIQCFGNGGVELYADNNKRFETTGDGATLTGNLTVSGTVDGVDIASLNSTVSGKLSNVVEDNSPQLGGDLASNGHDIKIADATGYDGNNLYMGSDNDCRIIHDGSNFSITESTGDVTIQSADDIFLKPQGGENGIKIIGNGSVELYYDNSKKFETLSGGAELTGSLNLTSELNFTGNGDKQIDFATLNGSNTITLRHQDGGSYETAASFTANGGAAITHNGSTKIQTTAQGISITGNATSSIVTLTDGSNIAVDLSSGTHFTVTLGGNRTFTNSGMNTSSSIGSSGSIFIVQDGTGSRTAAFQSDYKFAGGTAPTLSTAANAVDRLDYVVRATNVVHAVVTLDVK